MMESTTFEDFKSSLAERDLDDTAYQTSTSTYLCRLTATTENLP